MNARLLVYIGLGTRCYEKSFLNYSLDLLDNLGDLYLGLRVVVLYPYILLDLEVKLLFGFLYGRALWFGWLFAALIFRRSLLLLERTLVTLLALFVELLLVFFRGSELF